MLLVCWAVRTGSGKKTARVEARRKVEGPTCMTAVQLGTSLELWVGPGCQYKRLWTFHSLWLSMSHDELSKTCVSKQRKANPKKPYFCGFIRSWVTIKIF